MVWGRRSDSLAKWTRGPVRLALALAMATFAFVGDASAQYVITWDDPTAEEMRFVVARSSAPGCEPNCPEWISAEGPIAAGTPALLKQTLKKLGGRKLPIIVNSPGGNVDAAIQLGRIIRKNKLDIAIGKTEFSDCWPGTEGCGASYGKGTAFFGIASDSGAMCNSACPLMFAGGIRRVAGGWAYLGVHQITTTWFPSTTHYRTTYRVKRGKKYRVTTQTVTQGESYKTYKMSKGFARKISAYLKEMGVGQGVLDIMKATPASDIKQIGLHDMLTMKLATSTDTQELFTKAALCMFDPPAPNCREIPGNKPAGGQTPAAKPAVVAAIKAKTGPPLSQPAKAPAPKPLQAAPGNSTPDMRFVVVRGRDSLCNPDCPEWISAEGVMTPQTPQKLRQLLDTLGNRRLPVVISSQGGSLFSALAAGRLIHERKLDVAVARTTIVGCDPPEAGCLADNGAYVGLISDFGVECDSACALMLAAGAKRLVDPKARLSMSSRGQTQLVKAYLEEMEMDPALFAAIGSVERQLEPDMMLKVGLTTGPESVEALTGPAICKTSPKPDNCLLPPTANAESPAKL